VAKAKRVGVKYFFRRVGRTREGGHCKKAVGAAEWGFVLF
jgi:hypothetical protein